MDFSKTLGTLIAYRCTICGVIFETREKTLEHKAEKHGWQLHEHEINKTLTTPKSTGKNEIVLNVEATTPDVVKVYKRNKIIENRRCKFCLEIIKTPYNSQIIIEPVNEQFLACRKCYGKIINGPDAFIS